jgi:hypothetical protein
MVPTLCAYLYTQLRHSGRDCRTTAWMQEVEQRREQLPNPGYRDVSGLPSLALDTRFPAGMTIFVYKGMRSAWEPG